MSEEEIIAAILEDYTLCNSLQRKGLDVPENLLKDKEQYEQLYINDYVIPALTTLATDLLSKLECEVHLAVKKDCNGNVSIENELGHSAESWFAKEDISENTSSVAEYEPTDDSEQSPADDFEQKRITRGARKKFKVILNGKEVEGEDGATILANTIRLIGFRRVAAMNKMFARGQYNLVDRRKRPDKDQVWQRKIDDWYVYTNMQNPMKIKVLRDIAKKQGLDLQVYEEATEVQEPSVATVNK